MYLDESELVPASSTWRHPLELRARKGGIEGLRIESVLSDTRLENISCATVHDEGNHIVVADTSRNRNVCRVIGTTASAKSPGAKLSVVTQFTQPDTFTDVSWVDICMLGASVDGQVYRYTLNPDKNSPPKDVTEVYSHNKLKGMAPSVPPPGRMGYSTRIKRVSINPQEPHLFATMENFNIHVWDGDVPTGPAVSKKLSDWPLSAMAWNTHQERRLMVGGLGRSLRLFDADSASVVWKREEVHAEGITDIKWHPYVPWWVASAGLDGLIKVWDLRCGIRPMITLEDHLNAVTSIAWSPTHTEILASGGADRRLKLWSLSLSPHHLLFSEDTEWPVNYVGFWKSGPFKCFAVTDGGEVISANMDDAFIAPLVPSGFEGTNGQARDVEKSIYCREFNVAFDKALETAKKFSSQHRPDLALGVLELCYQRSVPDVDSEIKPDLPLESAMKIFASDLHTYSYYVPPRYHEIFGTKVSDSVMARIQTLRLRLEVQRAVKDENWHDIADRWKEINELLQKDNTVFPLSLLVGAVQMVMPHDYVKALEMGVELADTLNLYGDFSNFAPVARLLLFPTVYELDLLEEHDDDGEEGGEGNNKAKLTDLKPDNRELAKKLASQDDVVEQLVFCKKFYQALWKEQDIVSFVEDNSPGFIWSATINRMYLNTLLLRQSYDKFLIAAFDLLKPLSGTPFHDVVEDMVAYAQPRLQKFLKESQVRDKAAPLAAQQVKVESALFIALTLLFKCSPLPEEVSEVIVPAIRPLTGEVEHTLLLLLKNPDAKAGTSGRAQVAARAKELLAKVEEIVQSKKGQKDPLIEKDIKKLNNMLSGFI